MPSDPMGAVPMSRRGKTALGVDWTGPEPILVEALGSRRGAELRTCLGPDSIRPGEAAALWAEVRFRQNAGRTTLAAALPVHSASILTVTAPFASRSKAGKVWPALLDLQLPFPVEDCVFAVVEAHPLPDGRTRARAVVARREPVRVLLGTWTGSGAPPNVLDFEGLALWSQSLLESPPGNEREPRIVASVSATRTALAVGIGSHFETAFSAQGNLLSRTESEAVRNRLIRSLRAVGLPPDCALAWYWTGPGASGALGPVQAAFESALGPVQWRVHDRPDTFLARSLARRALRPDAWPCSLLEGDLTPRVESELAARRIRRLSRLGLAAAVLLLLLNAISTWDLARRDAASRRELADTARAVAGTPKVQPLLELQTVRTSVERRLAERAPVERMFQPPLSGTLRRTLRAAQEEQIRIRLLDLGIERAELSGWAGREVTGLAVRKALEEAGPLTTPGTGVEWKDGRATIRLVRETAP
jgi:hypothetical protein